MVEEETREQIEDIINNNGEPVKEEPINEETQEEEIKPKSIAKPKIKITKEPIIEEPIIEEPIVEEEQPKKIDKLKQVVKCPDCGLSMTQHTLLYIHKRRGFCKAVKEPENTPEPEQQPTPKITEEIVNDYIKQIPDIVSTYLRNERSMKAQKKQMHVRSLLYNVF